MPGARLPIAFPLAREVLQLAPMLRDPYFDVFALGNLGEVLVHVGELQEAGAFASGGSLIRRTRAVFVPCAASSVRSASGVWRVANSRSASCCDARLRTRLAVVTQLRAHYALYLAHRNAGDAVAALAALESFRRLKASARCNNCVIAQRCW